MSQVIGFICAFVVGWSASYLYGETGGHMLAKVAFVAIIVGAVGMGFMGFVRGYEKE